MSPTRVSVVIPVHNGEAFVETAIDSALAQTYRGLEVIVVNDGSTDGTPQRIERYRNRLTYIAQENRGVSAARNAGIAAATGELIAFLDADDVWLPEKLSLQVQTLWDNPTVGLVHTNVSFINEQGDFVAPHIPDFPRPVAGQAFASLLLDGNGICTSTVVARRECLEGTGLFTEGVPYAEDYELWLKVAAHHDLLYVPRPLVRYRIHPRSASILPRPSIELSVLKRVLDQHPEMRNVLDRERLKGHLFNLACAAFDQAKAHRRGSALRFLFAAAKENPLLFLLRQLSPSSARALRWYHHRLQEARRRVRRQEALVADAAREQPGAGRDPHSRVGKTVRTPLKRES